MRLVPTIEEGRPVLRDAETGRALAACSRVRIDWVDGDGMEVTATWAVDPDPEAPSRQLGREDFLREPEAPVLAAARDDDDDRPQNRRPLS
jgi:hypothetical protein